MTYQELNQYILHYLTEDKTKRAIMLTAPWGTGKSYYIQNELKTFLETKNYQCIVVSLYGLNDTAEISKSIYLGTRLKFLNTTSEKATTAKIAAQTIVKGVSGFLGIDLSKDEEALKQLYASVDLTKKLVILEDLERSGIDILEVLGYVNNLVEQDGVKVLLVANEEELIQYTMHEGSSTVNLGKNETFDRLDGHKTRVFTDSTRAYLKVKEKTVGDTIQFEEDYQTAIQKIIQMFDNKILDRFSTAESIENILYIMMICQSYNLRSFIFACQKASDIFEELDKKSFSDNDFIQAIFFGILFFVLRWKTGKNYKWGEEKYFSTDLGYDKIPLFKFCYDYITMQQAQFNDVENAHKAFSELILYDKTRSNADKDIAILQTYYTQTERNIIDALSNIEKRLEDPKDISFYQYGTIAVYAIIVKGILSYNIDTIKSRLVENLKGEGDKLELEQIFRTLMSDECTMEQKAEYEELRKEMTKSLKCGNKVIPDFDYQPEQSKDFYDYIKINSGRFHVQESFAAQLDIKRLSEMFGNSSAEQKQQIRMTFVEMYRDSNIRAVFANDKESIERLLKFIKVNRDSDAGDKIQQLQYDWFIQNLEEIVEKLT